MAGYWTYEMIEILRAGWASGKSTRIISGEIFSALRINVTRDAVIGKAHNLGLGPHPKGAGPIGDALSPIVQTLRGYGDGIASKECLWPMDGNPCTKPAKHGKPYCDDHCKRAYLKPKKMRNEVYGT